MSDDRPREAAEERPRTTIDPLLPAETALKAESIGAEKVRMDGLSLLTLAVLAGAFIALGAMFSTTVTANTADSLPFGVSRLLAGLTFSLGLILVVVGGAELFTGNNLMVMAWAGGRIRGRALLRAWTLVYIGNLIGSLGTVALVFLSGQYEFGTGAVGAAALGIAESKAALPAIQALFLGILCNVLVCLAVWMSYSARTVTGKVLTIVPPITAFVAAGFEHSIANMYFIPLGLLIKNLAPAPFWTTIGSAPADFGQLTFVNFIGNLVPVTVGNVIGGGVLVGIIYWFVYLRHREAD